jgi:chromosomal replication initiation ATPase DnaA
MNAIEQQLAALTLRIKRLEDILLGNIGQVGPRTGALDEVMVESVCLVVGVTSDDVRSSCKAPHLVAKRRAVVTLMRERLHWSWGRIARATGKTPQNLKRLIG